MNRDFYPEMTGEFDARVRETLAALPEKRRRRMTAVKLAAIALAAALCLGGTAIAANGALFPLLFPDGGGAIDDYAAAPAAPAAENENWRLTVGSVLMDENSLTGLVSLRLENLKGDGKMPFKTVGVLPEYRNRPGMSWAALDEISANETGEFWFGVRNAAGDAAFTGPFYLDTERSTENVYYLEAALIGYPDYSPGDTLTLSMSELGGDGAALSVTLPEPEAMPCIRSGDGRVTLSQIGLRIELETDESAVDAIDYAALRMADGSETVIIDAANRIDRTLYALGGAAGMESQNGPAYTAGIPGPAEGGCGVATYLLAVTPELESVRAVVVNDMEYTVS